MLEGIGGYWGVLVGIGGYWRVLVAFWAKENSEHQGYWGGGTSCFIILECAQDADLKILPFSNMWF